MTATGAEGSMPNKRLIYVYGSTLAISESSSLGLNTEFPQRTKQQGFIFDEIDIGFLLQGLLLDSAEPS